MIISLEEIEETVLFQLQILLIFGVGLTIHNFQIISTANSAENILQSMETSYNTFMMIYSA